MCGRYVQTMPADAVRELFRTTGAPPNLAPSWNVAPTQSAPVVRRHPETGAPRSGDGMAFAGLWEHWRGEGDEVVRTFAIVTTDASAPMRAVHDRMPVILAPGDWAEWLEGEDPARLLRPAPDDLLRFWPVSRAVNSPRNNGPELLDERPQAPAGGGGPNPA